MPTTRHLLLPLLFLLAVTSHAASPIGLPPASAPGGADGDVHDLLPRYGLPRGLLPGNVVNYTISDSGDFTVKLSSPCYVQFSNLVYYDRTVRGRASYGSVSDISGVQVRKFFIWLSITRIAAIRDDGGTIQFSAGFLSEKHPFSEFADVRPCKQWDDSSSSSSSSGGDPAFVAAA